MLRRKSAWLASWLMVEVSCILLIGCRAPGGGVRELLTRPAGSDAQNPSVGKAAGTGRASLASHVTPVSTRDTPSDAPLASKSQNKSDVESVSRYAQASFDGWQALVDTSRLPVTEPASIEASQLYHDRLADFIARAAEHRQLGQQQGIKVLTADGRTGVVRINYHGFPWKSEDFNEFHLARDYRDSKLARHWSQSGLGIPLVVVRNRATSEAHLGKSLPFAATAVLRPIDDRDLQTQLASNAASPAAPVIGVLDLFNPLQVRSITVAGQNVGLAHDISAPLVHIEGAMNRDNIQDFLRPSRHNERAGLRMLEPYQPGKIPVVFVHGLLSDSVTWINVINDLRAVPWFNERYQIWAFQYASGQPFLRSAAELRHKLAKIVSELDSQSHDPALSSITLVGHSMGGLVSKLQVTSSGSALWDSVASRPLQEVRAPATRREEIHDLFFFEPLPSVKRLVCIGTPHQGSGWAKTLLGRVGSQLVSAPRERTELLQQLIKDNPDVFSEVLQKGIPSSVDFLRPDSPFLQATYELPVNPEVSFHSIIGTGHTLRDGSPADGVVPVTSARHPAAISERYVDATHTELLDRSETSDELAKILAVHVREFDAR